MDDIIIAIIGIVGGILITVVGGWGIPKIFNSKKKGTIINILKLASFAFELFGDKLKEKNPDLYDAVNEALDESIRVLNDPTLTDEAKEKLIAKYKDLFNEFLALFGFEDKTTEEIENTVVE